MKSLALAITLAASTAYAGNEIGVDGVAVLPLGDYSHIATVGAGALGRLEVGSGPGFVAVHAGVILHAGGDSTNSSSVTFVPIYAGYRLPLGTAGAYLAGEIGLTEIFGTVATPVGSMSSSEAKLGLAAFAGLRRGALDLRAGLLAPDASNVVGLIACAGYDFASF